MQVRRRIKLAQCLPFIGWMKQSTSSSIKADFWAGLTGAILVLPQGVAYAMIAGLPPEYGLYTAIIPAILAALFGSSHHLISGPTAALSVIVFTTVSQFAEAGTPLYLQLCFTLTLCAGLVQLLFGVLRFGAVVNFVSHSVVLGFTAGAAVVIGVSQLKHVLGLSYHSGQTAVENIGLLTLHLSSINSNEFAVGVFTMSVCVLIKHLAPKVPNMLLALLAAMGLAYLMNALGLNVTLVGEVESSYLQLSNPLEASSYIEPLLGGIFAVAMLGLVEAVSIGRSVALKSRQSIDSNQESIGQGVSNIVGSFFSCYVSSGSFTRSGVNYASGAKTPFAAVFAGLILLIIMINFVHYAAYIPIAGMGGLLLVVAWNLVDADHIYDLFKHDKKEMLIFSLTALSALFLHLEWAIYVGVATSLFFYLRRTSKPVIEVFDNEPQEPQQDITVVQINGSIFFGCVQYLHQELQSITTGKVVIVGRRINFIDHVGVQMLDDYVRTSEKQVYFCRFKECAKHALIEGSTNIREERFADQLSPLLKLINKR